MLTSRRGSILAEATRSSKPRSGEPLLSRPERTKVLKLVVAEVAHLKKKWRRGATPRFQVIGAMRETVNHTLHRLQRKRGHELARYS